MTVPPQQPPPQRPAYEPAGPHAPQAPAGQPVIVTPPAVTAPPAAPPVGTYGLAEPVPAAASAPSGPSTASARWTPPTGPLPMILGGVGLILILVAYLGPFGVYTEDKGGYSEITEVSAFGLGFSYVGVSITQLPGVGLLPVLLTIGLLIGAVAADGPRRPLWRLGTVVFGAFTLGMIIVQFKYWRSSALWESSYTTGGAPQPDAFRYGPEPPEDATFVPGWGLYLMGLALLTIVAAAATAADRVAHRPPASPAPYAPVPAQGAGNDPHGLVVTPDPPPAPGRWQRALPD